MKSPFRPILFAASVIALSACSSTPSTSGAPPAASSTATTPAAVSTAKAANVNLASASASLVRATRPRAPTQHHAEAQQQRAALHGTHPMLSVTKYCRCSATS